MYAFERDVMEFVEELFGEEGRGVVRFLMKRPWSTDEEIAGALKLRVNVVRKVLYDLNLWNCVVVRKIRRGEGRNYEFKWTVNFSGFYRRMVLYYSSRAEDAERGARFLEGLSLYSCGRKGHPRLTFDEVFEYEFKCPLCGEMLFEVDESGEVRRLLEEAAGFREKVERIERHYRRFSRRR